MKKIISFWAGALALVLSFCSCGLVSRGASKDSFAELSVVSWNVQTFFDAQKDGCEYADFIQNDNWNSYAYLKRLERLSQVLLELDADVYVLQEIENTNVLYDVCNQLTQKAWKTSDGWTYSCFYKNEGSSIGCGVISKYPLGDFTTHMLDVRTKTDQPDMRPIMKLSIYVKEKKLFLFVNHWKSKSGGTDSEIWRNFQESLLAMQIDELNSSGEVCGILCGDFNRSVEEFPYVQTVDSKENVKLRGDTLNCESVLVQSPWYDKNGNFATEIGSYFYKDHWERIDNIFAFGNIQFLNFEPCNDAKWTTENGTPYSYKVYTGDGYSDHLPVKALLLF